MASAWREGIQRLHRQAQLHDGVTDPRRLAALEAFRAHLIAACGDEPTICLVLRQPPRGIEDLAEVSLADYVGCMLLARHAAAYIMDGDEPVVVAQFGVRAATLGPSLMRWLRERGSFVRTRVAWQDLEMDAAAALQRELDDADAAIAVPIVVDGRLWGAIVAGPGWHHDCHELDASRLTQYGLAMAASHARHTSGLPTRSATRGESDSRALRSLEQLWSALKPAEPVRLLILDEAPKMVEQVSQALGEWGFAVTGVTTERSALAALDATRPQIMVVDLTVNRRPPTQLLDAAKALAPSTVVIGTTAGDLDDAPASRAVPGVTRVFRKPFGLLPLVNELLETALRLGISSTPSPS